MNNIDFLMESFYLDELDIIRLKKSKKLYLFCGYGKDSILNKAKSLTNYAYESEMYLLEMYRKNDKQLYLKIKDGKTGYIDPKKISVELTGTFHA